MKEEWLFPGAAVPVDVGTTAALVAEIKRLIDVVGDLILKQGPDYERGFVDGMQKQAQSSVDNAVNAMAQPQQEPVRYEFQVRDGTWHPFLDKAHYENTVEDGAWPVRALYTSTPQRKPLADEEITEVWRELKSKNEAWSDLDFARAIEAKLKDKTHDN